MTEGGRRGAQREEKKRGAASPPVQTVVALICSISTITGSASSLVVIGVIFTRTEEPRELQRAKKNKKLESEKSRLLRYKNT